MKARSIFKSLTYISLLSALMISCRSSRPEIVPVNPAFREYVSGYTSGMIKRDSPIRIELVKEIKNLDSIPQEELNELFEIEPAVDGKMIAIGERLVEFIPDNPLPVNQFFTVHFNLDELMDVKDGLEEFTFQFATFEQVLTVDFDGLRPFSNYEIDYQKLSGTIKTTDSEDIEKLKKSFTVELEGKNIPFKIEADNRENKFKFLVDSIRRKNADQELIVKWDGTPINSFSKGEEKIIVPSLGDFGVIEVKIKDDEGQSVEIDFSEPLKYDQQLDGIVSINGVEDLTYKIRNNVLQIFLPKHIEGTKKLSIGNGIRNSAGAKMNKAYSEELWFHAAYPKVKLIGSGSILPNSQGLIFPFEAIALKSVDVRVIKIYENNVHHFLQVNDLDGSDELTRFGKIIAEKKIDLTTNKSINLNQWNTHIIDLEKLIKAEPGAIYQVALKFKKSYSTCECSPSNDQDNVDEETEPELWNERNWHTYGYEGYSDWSWYDDEYSPCSEQYYYGKAVKRNILASDIGMIYKLDEDKTAHAFLSDMVSTQPLANANITYYDYTKQVIASGLTDNNGMLTTKLNRKPFLMIAKKENQRGYLKLTDGKSNSLSKFDVSGVSAQSGIKGYIYAERGVWRPGDSLFIHFMLQDKKKSLPKGHPVKFEFIDPNGNIIYETSKSTNVNGIYDFRTVTGLESPTGNYTARINVGNNTFIKSLKVETIKPNRLKIQLKVNLGTKQDSCFLTSKWLHGASAKNLTADVQVKLSPTVTKFKSYPNHIFDSPIRNGESEVITVFHGQLDIKGFASFQNEIKQISDVPGKMRANYVTKVFEKSGDFSIDRSSDIYSPYEHYVGLASPELSKYDQSLETDKSHQFEVVYVNENGKTSGNPELEVKVYKLDWNWWYDGEAEDLTQFTARNNAVLVKDENIKLLQGKGHFNFSANEMDYGRYLFTVTDKIGGHQTGQIIRFDWPYWNRSNRADNEFAKMLSFTTDKTDYVKGEKIKMSFPSPSEGRALISVETSEKVIKKFWITTQKGETFHEFEATADMSPNAYIHVTLTQPHNATKNDMPIRLYGVLPVKVDDPATHIYPVISMPDKIRPESKVAVKVSEKNGKKMSYTLALVDDGLLDLTHFQTPQPHTTFYAKEALGVKTWDIYDDVIGAFSGKLENLLSIGGDGNEIVGNGPKANRFKPMVTVLGPFEINAGSSKTHQIDIPNYVGSVRVMVVARNEAAYGNTEKTVQVKKPLMVLATLPRALGPGEEFALPVDVFAMEKHVKNVNIKIEANDLFELSDSKSKSIQFNDIGDEIVNIRLKTKLKMGVGIIKISASSGNETAYQEIEIDVRPSNPVVFETKEFQLDANKEISTEVLFDGLQGTNKATVEISSIPAIHLEKRIGYLIHYPHGCIEQTTSAVFPQLHLTSLMKLSEIEKKSIDQNIKAGLKRLQLFQTYDGGFAYWPGESSENEWGTNYAGHFMLEAEAAGYSIPGNMKSRWVSFQKEKARNWSSKYTGQYRNGDQLTQAYRLYLLASCNQAEIGAMNRLREESLSSVAKWRLAGAYYLIGQKDAAKELIKSAEKPKSPYRELSGTYGSLLRDNAIILESLSEMDEENQGYGIMKEIANELHEDLWLSTQETAYALLAIAKYCKASSASVKTATIIWDNEKAINVSMKNALHKEQFSKENNIKQHTAWVKNTGSSKLFLTVITEKIPLKDNNQSDFSKLKISVAYEDLNNNPLKVEKLQQGTEFYATITLTNPSNKITYREMALNQIFPCGWEIHNVRLYGNESGMNAARYQDIRDDRVLSYYDLKPEETKTIRIQLIATYSGRFYLPAIYSEAMYDHSIHAKIPGKWIEVK